MAWREVSLWSAIIAELPWKSPATPQAARRHCCMDTHAFSLQGPSHLPQLTALTSRHCRVLPLLLTGASTSPEKHFSIPPTGPFSLFLPYSAIQASAWEIRQSTTVLSLQDLLYHSCVLLDTWWFLPKQFYFFHIYFMKTWKSWDDFEQKAFLYPSQHS